MLTLDEMLRLSPFDFDEGPNGWRALDAAKDVDGAVEAVRRYLNTHTVFNLWRRDTPSDPEGRTLPVALLRWHLGQLMAIRGYSEGDLDDILDHMEQAAKRHPDVRFRAYIRGTIAFLLGDERGLRRAMKMNPVHPEVLERASRRIDGSHHPYYLILVS